MKIDLDAVESLVREVAETALLPHFQKLLPDEIQTKLGDDPVTVADKESEKRLTAGLKALWPGSQVLGEEAFFADPRIASRFDDDAPLWIVDPLDGTRQFVAGEKSFGIIVALVQKRQTIAALHYLPLLKRCVQAERGAGAFLEGTRLKVLDGAPLTSMQGRLGARLREAFVASHPSPPPGPVFERLGTACEGYLRLVAPPAQIHFLANYQMITPWDNAAGTLIFNESGGYSAHWDGRAYDDPSAYHIGLLQAPDRGCWEALRAWIATFCPLPAR